jgi:hypothetical protein
VLDRPAHTGVAPDEIEVTPAMLRVGADRVCLLSEASPQTVAYAVFTAMVHASPSLAHTRLLDRTEFPVK